MLAGFAFAALLVLSKVHLISGGPQNLEDDPRAPKENALPKGPCS